MYDDRRRLSGDPIVGLPRAAALERIFAQYTDFESARWPFAVSARTWLEPLVGRRRERNDHLYVSRPAMTVGSIYHGRFDEDDFEAAYRELENATTQARARRSPKRPRDPTSQAMNHGDFDAFDGSRRDSMTRITVRVTAIGSLRRRVFRSFEELPLVPRCGHFGAVAGCRRTA